MEKLFAGRWPHLLRVTISRNSLRYGCAELEEEPAWPLMTHLNMGQCGLQPESAALLQVVKIKWSQLQFIDLHKNPLQVEGFRNLFTAPWHNVSAINLDSCLRADEEVACLTECTWPLESLSLCRVWLNTSALAHLSNGNWPNLKKLDLSNNLIPLPAAAIAQLVKGRWPLLEQLCLCGNGFCDICILSELKRGDWPLLKTLQLDCNAIPPASAGDLIKGNWPLLENLIVTFKTMDRDIVETLTRGNWPNLRELQLSSDSSDEASDDIWFAAQADCIDMCESKWPGIQLLLQ